ncbi:AMP-binding protein [Thalassotalea sp. G2M2-11]|uniref:AMP-binding protein n=1 Tax=Thalassotalea sp. G2M2-11 TaxID=2787627 RepID=UPI0019D19718|nr:AMP-binding protein [Thalassotalea sp. G2M2-11]
MNSICFWHTDILAEHYGSKTAIVEPKSNYTISYQELDDKVQQAKTLLTAKDKLLLVIVAEPNLSTLVFYLAALQARHTVWFVERTISDNELNDMFELYQVDAIIRDEQIDWCCFESSNEIKQIHADIALLISTSGSTASQKLVKLSYDNLAVNCQSICQFLPITSASTTMTTLPWHYSFGLSVLHSHLAQGAMLVLTDGNLMSREFWQLFKEYQVRCFYGVPYHYQMLLKLGLKRLPFADVDFFAVAGGKLTAEQVEQLAEWCQSHDKQFYLMYGQTEATARISFLAPELVIQKPTSIGQVIPYGKLWLIDEQGNKVNSQYTNGELCYSGPNVMQGYAESRDDLSFVQAPAFLATGDLAYYDREGDFYIAGRLKRFIKIQGHRISLDEVERFICQLLKLDSNSDFVCTGVDDALIVVLVNEIIRGEQGDVLQHIKQIKTQLSQYLSVHSQFIKVAQVNTIPRLSSGKVDYQSVINSQLGDV